MHEALRGLHGVACIADDVLIYGSGDSVEEAQINHDNNLIALLKRCREMGIRLNKDKLQLNKEVTRYMGHELTKQGLQPDSRKLIAISEMAPPADKQALLRMLGTAWFLALFVQAIVICDNF